MKVRNDFVTNSSSSSFVIARKPVEFDAEGLKRYPILGCVNELVSTVIFSSGGNTDTEPGDEVHNKSELDAYIVDKYRYFGKPLEGILEIDGWYRDVYTKALDAINRGCTVIFKELDYDDNTVIDLITQLTKMDIGIEILDSSD